MHAALTDLRRDHPMGAILGSAAALGAAIYTMLWLLGPMGGMAPWRLDTFAAASSLVMRDVLEAAGLEGERHQGSRGRLIGTWPFALSIFVMMVLILDVEPVLGTFAILLTMMVVIMALSCIWPPRIDPDLQAVIRAEFRDPDVAPTRGTWIISVLAPFAGIAVSAFLLSGGRAKTLAIFVLIAFAGAAPLHAARRWRTVPRIVGGILLAVAALAP